MAGPRHSSLGVDNNRTDNNSAVQAVGPQLQAEAEGSEEPSVIEKITEVGGDFVAAVYDGRFPEQDEHAARRAEDAGLGRGCA